MLRTLPSEGGRRPRRDADRAGPRTAVPRNKRPARRSKATSSRRSRPATRTSTAARWSANGQRHRESGWPSRKAAQANPRPRKKTIAGQGIPRQSGIRTSIAAQCKRWGIGPADLAQAHAAESIDDPIGQRKHGRTLTIATYSATPASIAVRWPAASRRYSRQAPEEARFAREIAVRDPRTESPKPASASVVPCSQPRARSAEPKRRFRSSRNRDETFSAEPASPSSRLPRTGLRAARLQFASAGKERRFA